MSKKEWKPGNMIYPLPAVMVSCGDINGANNIITVAWTGTINSEPPMCYISVRPERHSYKMIKEQGAFVINLTTSKLAEATDWCGVRSGRNYDKFKEMKLTPIPAKHIKAPMIEEAPVCIECKVTQIMPLGSHDMFIAEVLAVHADEHLIDKQTGALDLRQTNPISYIHGSYYEPGSKIGRFGYSVKKKNR